jgi:cytochrome P450
MMEIAKVLGAEEVDLTLHEFWLRPTEEREGAFASLRAERPVFFTPERGFPGLALPVGPGFWSLTRHADILTASRMPELFSSAAGATSITSLPPEFNAFFGGMINMDDPRHGAQRRIVSRGFTPRALAKLEAGVRRRADEMIDRVIERGECDFVASLAAPLPLEIIVDLMGIPESETEMVFRNTNKILGLGDPDLVAADQDLVGTALRAGAELAGLMKEMAEDRRKRPREDLTSQLLDAGQDGGALTGEDLTSFFVLLVVAGNETTRNAISHGMKALCDYPAERRRWAVDFDGLAPTAVEEIVRWASPVIFMRRNLTQDTTMFGPAMKAGDKVVLWYASGNRDEAVFDDPHRFDVGRSPNPHVGFGGPGPHFCLGAHLARREITVMFRELLTRVPDIAAVGEPDRLLSNFIHGIKHLDVDVAP